MSISNEMQESWPPGTLRYTRADGVMVTASPGDLHYSTLTMIATHHWKDNRWNAIYEEDDGE